MKKRRPALVLSTKDFNSSQNVSVVCPITHTERRIDFEVEVPCGLEVDGFIRADQVICLDWRQRQAVLREEMPDPTVDKVSDIIVEDIIWGSEDDPHYIPLRGEVIEIEGDSDDSYQALVLSTSSFNYWQRISLICRIITPDNSITFPQGFAVEIPDGFAVEGIILTDQVKSWDWWERKAKPLGYLPSETVDIVSAKVEAVIWGD